MRVLQETMRWNAAVYPDCRSAPRTSVRALYVYFFSDPWTIYRALLAECGAEAALAMAAVYDADKIYWLLLARHARMRAGAGNKLALPAGVLPLDKPTLSGALVLTKGST